MADNNNNSVSTVSINILSGARFVETQSEELTVGAFRTAKGLGSDVSISVNDVDRPDSYSFQSGDNVAAVRSNKTAG